MGPPQTFQQKWKDTNVCCIIKIEEASPNYEKPDQRSTTVFVQGCPHTVGHIVYICVHKCAKNLHLLQGIKKDLIWSEIRN